MAFSTFMGNTIIDHMLREQAYTSPSAIWVSLHTADPGLDGSNELTNGDTGSYTRQQITLSAAASKATSNSGSLGFTGMPASSITHAGIWDNPSLGSGSFLMGGALTGSKAVNYNDTFQFPVSDFDITLT